MSLLRRRAVFQLERKSDPDEALRLMKLCLGAPIDLDTLRSESFRKRAAEPTAGVESSGLARRLRAWMRG